MIVLLFFAFVSGLVTILAPCIWPLLPIVLSASSTGGRRKPLGITLGIIVSFAVFTLTISYLVRFLRIDPDIFRYIAVAIIGFLGLSLVVPAISSRLEVAVSKLSSRFGGQSSGSSGNAMPAGRQGFWGGLLTGLSLGLVWSPCAGLILATIATLAVTAKVGWQVVLVTVAYVVGVGIPLFLFATSGNFLVNKLQEANKYTGRIQQVFGVVMIGTALLIFTNFDKILSAKLLEVFPSYSSFLNQLESNPEVIKQLNNLKGSKSKISDMVGKAVGPTSSDAVLPDYGPAPEFVGIEKWLNTEGGKGLSMEQLRGKVVLVDFWTYTCINCIRTLPYVTSWYNKYQGQGFVVVGVHTPEFEFEKKTSNVEMAIRQYGIKYPVAQDNDYGTWNAYSNHYWPAKYLIDHNGHIRYFHFGEGKYEETEMNIKTLLEEAGKSASDEVVSSTILDQTPAGFRTPETYIGLARQAGFVSPERPVEGSRKYSLPSQVPPDSFAFEGDWSLSKEYGRAGSGAALVLHFNASKVFLVAGPASPGASQGGPSNQDGKMKVTLDGREVLGEVAGRDVRNGFVPVNEQNTYNLIDLRGKIEDHILRIEFSPGIEIYAFTFG